MTEVTLPAASGFSSRNIYEILLLNQEEKEDHEDEDEDHRKTTAKKQTLIESVEISLHDHDENDGIRRLPTHQTT